MRNIYIVLGLLLNILAGSVIAAKLGFVGATGNDSPVECMVADDYKVDIQENKLSASWSSQSDEIVTGVCIKSGDNAFNGLQHSGLITQNETYNNCFLISGIGTSSVTVSETGKQGCKDISHIDVVVNGQPSPTPTLTMTPKFSPTSTLTPTPTNTPEATPTQTITPSPTPTDVPEVTPTPTDKVSPTPTVTPGDVVTPTPTVTLEPSPTPTGQPEPTATPKPDDKDDDDDDESGRGGGDVLGETTDTPTGGQILGYADTGSAQKVAEQMFVTFGLGMMVAGVKAIRYAKENA